MEERRELKKQIVENSECSGTVSFQTLHNTLKGALLRQDVSLVDVATAALDRSGFSRTVWRELFRGLPELTFEVESPCHYLRLEYLHWRALVFSADLPMEQSFKIVEARLVLLNAARFVAMTPRWIARNILIKNAIYYGDFTVNKHYVIELCSNYIDLVPDWVCTGVPPGGPRYALSALYILVVLKHIPPRMTGENYMLTMVPFLADLVACLLEWKWNDRLIMIVDEAIQNDPDNIMAASMRWAWTQLDAGKNGCSRDRALLVAMLERCAFLKNETRIEPMQSHQLTKVYTLRHSGSADDIRSSDSGSEFDEPGEMIEWLSSNMIVFTERKLTAEDALEYYGINSNFENPPDYAIRGKRSPYDKFADRYGRYTELFPELHNFLLRYELTSASDPNCRPGVRGRIALMRSRIEAGKFLEPTLQIKQWRSSGRPIQLSPFMDTPFTVWVSMSFLRNILQKPDEDRFFILPKNSEPDPNEMNTIYHCSEWHGDVIPLDFMQSAGRSTFAQPTGKKPIGPRTSFLTIPGRMMIIGAFETPREVNMFVRVNSIRAVLDPEANVLQQHRWGSFETNVNGKKHYACTEIVIEEVPRCLLPEDADIFNACKAQLRALFLSRYIMDRPLVTREAVVICREGFSVDTKYYFYPRDDFVYYTPEERVLPKPFLRPVWSVMNDPTALANLLHEWQIKMENAEPAAFFIEPKRRVEALLELPAQKRAERIMLQGRKKD